MADKVAGLLFKISADTKALRQGFDKTKRSVNVLQKQFSALGPIIAGAFSVQKIASFTKEIIGLAGKAEGVREAFDALNKPDLLKNLQKATRGTVSDLELMRYAVQARNFKIPLEQLASYFEFATKRAAQTGESVDYLVQSIITGIGRKSVMIMDNLGISAAELSEKFRELGDFGEAAGEIIRTELASMGEVSVTTAQQTEALRSTWENIKTNMGLLATDALNLSENLGKVNEELSKVSDKETMTDFVNNLKTAIIAAQPHITAYLAMIGGIQEAVNALISGGKPAKTPGTGRSGISGPFSLIGQPQFPGVGAPPGTATKATGGKPPPAVTAPGRPAPPGKIASIGAGLFPVVPPESINSLKEYNRVVKESTAITVDFGGAVAGAFIGLADSVGRGFDGVLNVLGNFAKQMGGLLIAYGVGMDAFKVAFANPWAAIAAGAALVAIGSAISNAASRGPSPHGVSYGGYSGMGFTPGTIHIEGELRGENIYWANERYRQSIGR